MVKTLKLSVIIPVYNAEEYLSQCLNSVINQDYPNIEIILVDDGSTDTSGIICDRYSSKYKTIHVIHKTNGGAADARNHGIEFATGDYLVFLDGDDFWDDRSAMTRLVHRISESNADVLNYSYKKYDNKSGNKASYFQNISPMPLSLPDKKAQLDYLAQHHLYLASACNKMIKREVLDSTMHFAVGEQSEDVEWSAQLIHVAKSMDFINEDFYCYRQHEKSVTHTINQSKCTALCKHIIRCIELYRNAEYSEKTLLGYFAAYQFGTFFIVQAMAKQPLDASIAQLGAFKSILSCHMGNRKLTVLNLLCNTIGYRATCWLIRRLYG